MRRIPNGVNEIGKHVLSILNRFPNAVFHYPPSQITRFPYRRWKLHTGGVLENPLQPCKFSQARLRDALDASSSSSIFWSFCGLSDMRANVQKHTYSVKSDGTRPKSPLKNSAIFNYGKSKFQTECPGVSRYWYLLVKGVQCLAPCAGGCRSSSSLLAKNIPSMYCKMH
jgi:hypothetical protein